MRDQRNKTYHAEWYAWGLLSGEEPTKPYSITKASRAIRDHLPSGWTVSRKNLAGSVTGCCIPSERHIYLDRAAPGWIVAHEIAHGQVAERGIVDGHHPVFRWHYLAVVASMFGSGPAGILEESFQWQRLRVEEVPTTGFSRLLRYLED